MHPSLITLEVEAEKRLKSVCSSTTQLDTIQHQNQNSTPTLNMTQAADKGNTVQQQISLPVPSAPQKATVRSNRLWSEALERLSPEDQESLSACPKPSSKLELLQSMLDITEKKQHEWDNQRWKLTVKGHEIVFAEQATEIVGWLDKFKTLGDIVVSYDPQHAALPWAGVRFLLDVSIERMMKLIVRCRIYEELYLDNEQIQPLDNAQEQLLNTLTTLYAAALRFLVKICRFFNKSMISRVAGAILNGSEMRNFLNKIAPLEQQVHHDVDNCYSKTSSLKIQQLSELLRTFEELLMRMDSRITVIHDGLEESQRLEILTWVSNIEYERLHYTARGSGIDNFGHWLLKHNNYLAWLEGSTSTILWLHGVPGAGKTKLVSTGVDHLLQDEHASQRNSALAYFYCDCNRPDTRSAESIMNSIARQLATLMPGGPILPPVVELHREKQKNAFASGNPTFEESSKVLLDLLPNYRQAVIIVDALDECDSETRGRLITAFCQLVDPLHGFSSGNAKIFIFSRRDADITDKLQFTSNISIGATDNLQDIT
ncbi:hypothetical protein VTN00DRAFT_5864 [Thermoascus crustaceus]|uniref:uncharacterized protein n=1 Tax=Thermoascus crustaceus TaxID=5088 RepID=UPI003742F3B4